MKKISVIIPMYNTEKYIRQCLDSVLRQTFQDMEIIVIDDGSADKGPEICEELGQTDARIRLYRQENGGVSAARNYGIELADGEYIFFLDSDDVLHPLLMEKMIRQAEKQQADLVFCGYRKLDAEKLDALPAADQKKEIRARFETAEGNEVEKWLHIQYVNQLSGIGGKLLRRSLIGSLRFDRSLSNGEDTLFLYYFIRRQVRAAYLKKDWYYYRIHPESVTQSSAMLKGERYFESSRRIRDEEYGRGQMDFSLTWENICTRQIERSYELLKNTGNRRGADKMKKFAAEERRHPMFGRLLFSEKLMYNLCFFCYPVYAVLNRQMPVLLKWKEAFTMRKKHSDIGIITFHCSNNYGAMLQAYGLKTFLRRNGKEADIVRYEPFYMTGRHWWIPYAPLKGLKGRIWGLFHMWDGFLAHLRTREAYAKQLSNMNYFRYKYLVDKKQRKILSLAGLKQLNYQCYVVGSDQIWNPDITCGLRKAYFGAFENKRKKRVVSYAASIGGAELARRYDKEFAELVSRLDAVSVREETAVPYVERLYGKEVTAVLDPVFFLKKESWQKVERIPARAKYRKYILVYVTETNREMSDYAKKLSQETGLPVIEVRAGHLGTDAGFEVDYTAGPAELLGYIHKAEYVVSNSFHAVAFSMIYEKQFLAFVHSRLGARVRNIIDIHGLQDRLCDENQLPDIHAGIDWETVRERTKEHVRASGEYLLKNLEIGDKRRWTAVRDGSSNL
jgi:glycosyltransferase involved in cell wall biosynthesis|nr:polysaccharide pyruvyl transferase family protein [uncultured Schaedlerella sp.]